MDGLCSGTRRRLGPNVTPPITCPAREQQLVLLARLPRGVPTCPGPVFLGAQSPISITPNLPLVHSFQRQTHTRGDFSARGFFCGQNSVFHLGAEFSPDFFTLGAEYSPPPSSHPVFFYFCSSAQKQDAHQANTYGEAQLFDNSHVCRITAGYFAVSCVFWGSQSQDLFPSNALKI